MPTRLSEPPHSVTAVSLPTAAKSTVSLSKETAGQGAAKLPYHLDHQVELLHLRADVEALLQQLQCMKQNRLVASERN